MATPFLILVLVVELKNNKHFRKPNALNLAARF
jgi:hypothetical protein